MNFHRLKNIMIGERTSVSVFLGLSESQYTVRKILDILHIAIIIR